MLLWVGDSREKRRDRIGPERLDLSCFGDNQEGLLALLFCSIDRSIILGGHFLFSFSHF